MVGGQRADNLSSYSSSEYREKVFEKRSAPTPSGKGALILN